MKVMEAHRARHLVLRLDRGEELPGAIVRALEEADVRSAWLSGLGTLEAAELAVFDARQRTYAKGRRFEPGGDIVSLSGNVAQLDGSTCVRLFATLARETEAGLTVVGGELMSGRAFAVELHVTVLEDAALARVADERTGQLTLVRGSAAPSAPSPEPRTPAPKGGPEQSSPSIVEMARQAVTGEQPQHLSPQRRERPREDFSEAYPEVGDMATHFHFGECKIISSDGDKIRLQQLKDLRVREVALSALRTELVSEDPETHQRAFRLLRKN
jgi:predicted DNA-binding protein with PD1-like motif